MCEDLSLEHDFSHVLGLITGVVCLQDAMATEKLAEGIRKFAADLDKLEEIVRSKMAA